jgi:hypothetical protein
MERAPLPLILVFVLEVMLGLMLAGAMPGPKAYRDIPVKFGEPLPATLSQFLVKLREATEAGNASLIFESVAENFHCLRDFGGVCDEHMTPREKFAAITGIRSGSAGDRNQTSLTALRRLLEAKYYALTTGHDATKTALLCGPAAPEFDKKLLAEIDKKIFGGDEESFWFEWVAVDGENVPVHSKPEATSPVLETLSLEMVHVDGETGSSDGWIAIDLPSGARGYVRETEVVTLLPEQLCFGEHPSAGWQISGFVGGGD